MGGAEASGTSVLQHERDPRRCTPGVSVLVAEAEGFEPSMGL